jgi:hypothetical protein
MHAKSRAPAAKNVERPGGSLDGKCYERTCGFHGGEIAVGGFAVCVGGYKRPSRAQFPPVSPSIFVSRSLSDPAYNADRQASGSRHGALRPESEVFHLRPHGKSSSTIESNVDAGPGA